MNDLLVHGLAAGARYALLAFGFALVYQTTGVFHFAHGAVYAVAGYAFYATVAAGAPWPVAASLALGAALLLGWLVEVAAYRPLRERRASTDVLFLTSLGLFWAVTHALALGFGHETRQPQLPNPVYELPLQSVGRPVTVTLAELLAAGAAMICLAGTTSLLHATRFGLAMRAWAANPALAEAMGLEARWLLPRVSLIASLLAAVAALCVTLDVGASPQMGLEAVITGSVATVVGGVGSLPGAATGGLLLGLLRYATALQFGARWEDAATFAVLLVVLLARPRGLFGRRS